MKRKMRKAKSVNVATAEPFKKHAKKPEPDVTPAMKRPAAHGPREAARAKRMTRLAHRKI